MRCAPDEPLATWLRGDTGVLEIDEHHPIAGTAQHVVELHVAMYERRLGRCGAQLGKIVLQPRDALQEPDQREGLAGQLSHLERAKLQSGKMVGRRW